MAKLHIVMLPFMAQGHLIPFLSLAKLISNRYPTYTVTIVNTPINVENLRPLVSSEHSNIQLRALPFNSTDHGLPPNSENSDSLASHHLIIRLMQSSESLEPYFEQLMLEIITEERSGGNSSSVCIISDVFFGWTVRIAQELNVFHAAFTTCGGYGTASYMSLWLHLPHTKTDAEEFTIPGFPQNFRLHRSQMSHYMRAADPEWARFLQKHIKLTFGSQAMLCNTVDRVESRGIQLLQSITGLKVFPIGPLFPLEAKSAYQRAGKKPGIEPEACIKWLDSHPPASVLYISFGSQNNVAANQMMELAAGIELSNKPFIWVTRPPFGHHVREEFKPEWLPEGFEERIKASNQGLLIRGWAPQLEILSQSSTGAFLSHCGWNSVLESLSRGIPVIAWPLASEQFYNAKMMEEELGVCAEIARGVNGEVGRDEVKRMVEMVMGEGKRGKEMKKRAVQFSKLMKESMKDEGQGCNGSSLMVLEEFLKIAVAKPNSSSANTATTNGYY